MKLGEFIEKFSHNNLIRLVYQIKGGHEIVLETWDDVSMDWEVNKRKGKNRHYINNEVIGLACISGMKRYSEAINIVIEKLENQPFIEEVESEYCNNSDTSL
ncbi:hypothetical protein M0Q50_08490 [bacterium]|jgi:hypothetical protein|nr:hypothetical protein [bacterium]